MLDLRAADLAPRISLETLHAVLRVFGESLYTLKVRCEMHSVTAAAAQQQSWPCKTSIRMDATASVAILQNLADIHWPIMWLLLRCFHDTPPAIAQLFQIDLTRMKYLSLSRLRIGVHTGDPAFRFQEGNWPALKHLDLSGCDLQDDFVVQLTTGQWPLLQKLNLSQNFLGLQGVSQLVAGQWPNLVLLDLQYNDFDHIVAYSYDSSVIEENKSFVKSIKVKWPAVELRITQDYMTDWTIKQLSL